MAQLIDHTILLITEAALVGERARSPDEFGACSVLQTALDQAKDIYVFMSSGTGLYMDMSSGYSYHMQRALDLINCNKLGGTKSSLFRRIVSLQPAIPYISVPTGKSPISKQLAKVEIEKSFVEGLSLSTPQSTITS